MFWSYWFSFLFAIRYVRVIINAYGFWAYKIVHPGTNRVFSANDVTVILPTVLDGDISSCMRSILACEPFKLLLVVSNEQLRLAQTMCKKHDFKNVTILGVEVLGKRRQMIRGLKKVKTPITITADDDVYWPKTLLASLLPVFDDPNVGATGPLQRVVRQERPSIWNILGIAYIERRNYMCGSANHIDGSISTLSGRTAAYRTTILQNQEFEDEFLEQRMMGSRISIGDDKALTRWIFSHGWKIKAQLDEDAVLYTTLESGWAFLHQCVRWARAHWQGNLAVVLTTSYWWKKHPWGCYTIYFGSLMTPAILVDGSLYCALCSTLTEWEASPETKLLAKIPFVILLLLSKVLKMIPHFLRHPSDIIYIPVLIAFSYIHGFINIYALGTMLKSNWSSRPTLRSGGQ